MKPLIIFLFLLVSILSFAQRKPKDTLGVSDCTEFYKEGKIYYDKLTAEKNKIDYSTLSELAIEDLNLNNIPSDNLIIIMTGIINITGGCPFDFITECHHNLNLTNPNYDENNFWDIKTINKLSNITHKNIIFKRLRGDVHNTLYFINEKMGIPNKEVYQYILSASHGGTESQKYFYQPYPGKPFSLKNTHSIYLTFSNYFGNIVRIDVLYNFGTAYSQRDVLTYQYHKKEWKLIKKVGS
ncbi:hypothetical protein [Chryseobacterium sp. BIGb0232]|uniref:hypothetical protein n=1 Tax=Chryseobacterium sp. BIGb0232 TaxID=2940598 RepID=UPI000F48D742|nr:hypothetical protein [Chryseobacterium sp. BIGb0232]MCS4303281.1 hypothetical protein [Chryseobacterium sp. BIGb0232]ROS11444.1 hypothetical protein EDF65_3856 [Chryseobacterium nakagawai]